MAWNTPSTWLSGAVLTAAQLNAQLRDNMKAIGDPRIAYTPTLTNATIGNGVIVARYLEIGKLIVLRVFINGGSTSSASGAISVSLPFAAHASGEQDIPLKVWNASSNTYGMGVIAAGGSTAALTTAGAVSALGNGHIIVLNGSYERA